MIPLFQYIDSNYLGILLLVCLFIADIIFLYFCIDLAFCSTKEEFNNCKIKSSRIFYVKSYLEYYKWVIYIVKIDIIMGGFFCGAGLGVNTAIETLSQDRCLQNHRWPSNSSGFIIVFCALSLITTIFTSYIHIMIYNAAGLK